MVYSKMRTLTLITISILVSACGPVKEIDETAGWSVERLYNNARAHLDDGQYMTAIERFEKLESRYPFGKFATQSQLDVAYAYYKFGEPESALAAVERFIKLNPRHETVDYAYYLRGLINFNRGGGVLDVFYDRHASDYDRNLLLKSYDDFNLLVRRFPDSRYVEDSRQRMIYLREQLARGDLKIAKYYASRSAWVAVAKRTNAILLDYQGTSVIPAALAIQLEAYEELGLSELAEDTRRIIELNFGNSS